MREDSDSLFLVVLEIVAKKKIYTAQTRTCCALARVYAILLIMDDPFEVLWIQLSYFVSLFVALKTWDPTLFRPDPHGCGPVLGDVNIRQQQRSNKSERWVGSKSGSHTDGVTFEVQ